MAKRSSSRGGATYVALLRGINVGKNKRVAMADLRALCESLGYHNVRTLLNSGNVVFEAPAGRSDALSRTIEQAIAKKLGVVCRVMVASAAELESIVDANTLAHVATDPARLLVCVYGAPADAAKIGELSQRDWGPDAFDVGPRAAYAWCANGILQSALLVALNRALGDSVTTRNWSTISKLRAMVKGETSA